jgi:hypothetical protein
VKRSRAMGLRLQGALLLAALLVTGAIAAAGGSAAPQAAPTNTGEPAISGTPTVGNTLTASRGTWNGSPTSFAYQWVRCPASGGKSDGSDCAAIGGATTSAYVPTGADVNRRLRVRVTASNADGSATAASNATTAVRPRTSGAPRNTSRPQIGGTMAVDQTVHATTGGWAGTQPITFSFQWLRCNSGGNNCVTLPEATDDAYTLREGDAGRSMRVRVTARNDEGSNSSLSLPSSVVQAAAGPTGAIKLPNGEVSIPATSVPSNVRLVVDRVDFSPNVVRSQSDQITIRVKVKDTRGFVVRDVLVFVRSTPLVTARIPEGQTAQDGWIQYTTQPQADFPIRNGYSVQFFVKAHRAGDPALAGVAAYRLAQVRTAR